MQIIEKSLGKDFFLSREQGVSQLHKY